MSDIESVVSDDSEKVSINVRLAERMLGEITQDMMAVKELLNIISSRGEFDNTHTALELLACHSGANADRLRKAAGLTQCFGSMEDWHD